MNLPIALPALVAVLAAPSAAQEAVEPRPALTVQSSSADSLLSPPRYPDVHAQSLFIVMADGTKLAADLFRPAHDETPVATPVPLV
ncbi:MAG: hypothetical protein AB1726_18735 [Planctomycetota bacterium]